MSFIFEENIHSRVFVLLLSSFDIVVSCFLSCICLFSFEFFLEENIHSRVFVLILSSFDIVVSCFWSCICPFSFEFFFEENIHSRVFVLCLCCFLWSLCFEENTSAICLVFTFVFLSYFCLVFVSFLSRFCLSLQCWGIEF